MDNKVSKTGQDLALLRDKLKEQQGEEKFEHNMQIARSNRKLIESLSYARKEAELTQAEVAKAMGTTQKQISKYENFEQSPSITKLIELCDQIGVDIILKLKNNGREIFHT